MESKAYGHDTQDAGDTEETEDREDTEVTAVVSEYVDSDIDQNAAEVFERTYVPFPPGPDMSPEEHDNDNDGWLEHVIETYGMVSPSDDEPLRDDIYADVLVKPSDSDDAYEEDTI
jgi:hypothetical protein